MGAGQWRLATTQVGDVPGARLWLTQPDLPQGAKFRYDARRTVMDLYVATSQSQGGPDGVTHLFCPESAFPFFLARQAAEVIARISDLLPDGTTLITGAARISPDLDPRAPRRVRARPQGDRPRRGGTRQCRQGTPRVPFGEYLPFQETMEWLGFCSSPRQRGGSRRRRSVPRSPFCPAGGGTADLRYEAIFSDEVMPEGLADGQRPGFLLYYVQRCSVRLHARAIRN